MRNRLSIILFFIAGSVSAQGVRGYMGVRGGAQLSNAYLEHTLYNTYTNTSFVPGYHGGVMFQLFTNRSPTSFVNAGLQTSLIYTQKGWKQTFPTDEPPYKIRMGYIELPLDALAYFGRKNLKFFFTVGMYLEYLVDVQKDPEPDPDNLGGAEFYTYEWDRDRKFGYGAKVSVGAQRDFPIGTFHVDVFGTFSISSFIKADDFSNRLPDLSNHWGVGFTVAYLIPFGKMEF